MDIQRQQKALSTLAGSLIGDSLSLPVHWIYNPQKILRKYKRIETLLPAIDNKYNPHRKAGQYTHYGDQILHLLKFISQKKSFSAHEYIFEWRKLWRDYSGYVDGATQSTLANSSPSSSDDFFGAVRLAPLLLLEDINAQKFMELNQELCQITHADPKLLESARFVAKFIHCLFEGEDFIQAMEHAADQNFSVLPIKEWVLKAEEHFPYENHEVAQKFGLTCHLHEALPLSLFLLFKYQNNWHEALIQNVMLGGDSAARGLFLGMAYGTQTPFDQFPLDWQYNLSCIDEIKNACSGKGFTPSHANLPEAKKSKKEEITFKNKQGIQIAATFELADKERSVAIFAHCFTCSKSFPAAQHIAKELLNKGISVLRFDFTGIGRSKGTLNDGTFSANIDDILEVSSLLKGKGHEAKILIGHSLGGAAILHAASRISGIEKVISIGAPFDPNHVKHLFEEHYESILKEGTATVTLGGKQFQLDKKFLMDLQNHNPERELQKFRGSSLIIHSPNDETVEYTNAQEIFRTLPEPKSLVSLEGSDHLLSKQQMIERVVNMIAAWIH